MNKIKSAKIVTSWHKCQTTATAYCQSVSGLYVLLSISEGIERFDMKLKKKEYKQTNRQIKTNKISCWGVNVMP